MNVPGVNTLYFSSSIIGSDALQPLYCAGAKAMQLPATYAYLVKWGPGKGCSPSPFTSTTFKPVDSVLANLLGALLTDILPHHIGHIENTRQETFACR